MAARIVWLNASSGGSLVLDEYNAIAEGEPLIAEIFLSLYVDAPADAGDPVPAGVERPGYWATSFDPAAIAGSKLWLVPYVRPVTLARQYAERWAADALAWMTTRGRLLAVEVSVRPDTGRTVVLDLKTTLPDETRKTFRIDVPYAV